MRRTDSGSARSEPINQRDGVNGCSRRLLLTTNTELKVMAPQAISGLSRPDATTAYLRGPRT
jgi:hypothetical protein